MTSKAACKRESIQSLYCATPGWPLETQSNSGQFSHAVSLESFPGKTATLTPRRTSTLHQRPEFAMQEF